jgi:hypothetical protein
MHRRHLICLAACWPAASLFAQEPDEPRPHYKISAGELHAALSKKFPLRFALAGLFELTVDAASLLLLPARQLLGATLVVNLSGAQVQPTQAGEADVALALRYEPSDQTLRGNRLQTLGLRWPGLRPQDAAVLQAFLPQVLRDAVGEVVLHKFSGRELALADTMGFEPDKLTVQDDGLLIEFGPKRPG